jgi:predicted nucleic acid-binding protein
LQASEGNLSVTVQKVAVDTDIVLAHLMETGTVSLLRKAMGIFFCYTTVFNAIELFSLARTEKEIQAVDDALYSMKVLGLNAKSAKNMGKVLARRSAQGRNEMTGLMAGLCIESRLPMISMNHKRFNGIEGLRVIPARRLSGFHTAEDILSGSHHGSSATNKE